MDDVPIISVCIPVYNNPLGLERLLNSLAIQTCRDFEVIVSDDSSDDSSAEIVKNFQKKLPSIAYVKNNVPAGSPGNWNIATRLARGKYIKVIHHDDWLCDKDSLTLMLRVANKQKCPTLLFTASDGISPKGEIIALNKPSQKEVEEIKSSPTKLLWKNIIGAPSAMMYSNSSYYFDQNLIWLVDVDFYLNLLDHNFALCYIESVLVSTTAGSPDQVTNAVENDLGIKLRETTYLMGKWKKIVSNNDYENYANQLGGGLHGRLVALRACRAPARLYVKTLFPSIRKKIMKGLK